MARSPIFSRRDTEEPEKRRTKQRINLKDPLWWAVGGWIAMVLAFAFLFFVGRP